MLKEATIDTKVLREHNREMVELWLITRGMRISTRPPAHPDEHHGRVGKPKSTPNQDLVWLEAISQPDARSTNNYLTSVLKDLDKWEPDAYDVLHGVYLGSKADVSLPEKWLKDIHNPQTREVKRTAYRFMRHYLEDALGFILYRAHRDGRLLYWPAPEQAKGYVEENVEKRREARYHYLREREKETRVTEAVRKAARRSGASEQAIWYWKKQQGWDGPTTHKVGGRAKEKVGAVSSQ